LEACAFDTLSSLSHQSSFEHKISQLALWLPWSPLHSFETQTQHGEIEMIIESFLWNTCVFVAPATFVNFGGKA
jgi:hypothetical protein